MGDAGQCNYLKTLDALSRMRDQCNGELALPQLCVVGDQTSGKSSLLECLTGVSFPVKAGICTRAPTVVECRRAPEKKYEIRSSPHAEFEVVAPDKVARAIVKAQAALLGGGGGGGLAAAKVCKTEIALRVWGPDQIDLQIVDLPGIIHNGDGKAETAELIETYIKSPSTLILLVSEAKQDEELVSALQLAAKYDPRGKRTLRILTKFDMFDSDESRSAATRLVIDGQSHSLGSHAVVCRSQGGAAYDGETEADVFQENREKTGMGSEMTAPSSSLPEALGEGEVPSLLSRFGVSALKARLPDVFTALIRASIPGLEAAARERIREKKDELRKLGETPLGAVAMIRECQRALSDDRQPAVTVAVTPAFHKFREAIHDTGGRLTAELVERFMVDDAFKCPFFQGEATYLRVMSEVVEWWRPHFERLLREVQRALAGSMEGIKAHAVGVSNRLYDKIDARWDEEAARVVSELRLALENILAQSRLFGTANHYLYDKYIEQQLMPDDIVETVVAALNGMRFDSGDHINAAANIRAALHQARDAKASAQGRRSVREHLAARVLNAVKAVWSVEKKNVTDAALKEIRDVAILQRADWIEKVLLVDAEIAACAVEDEDVGDQRQRCNQITKAMNLVLGELASLREEEQEEAVDVDDGNGRPADY